MTKYLLAILLLSSTQANALEAQEIIDMQATPAEKGLAVITEVDDRDFGFGDFEVEIEMILQNSSGQKSVRKMRNKTFEVKEKQVGDKTLIVFDTPRDVSGTAFLTFSKILEPDDQWLYLPALKRVKRISSKNKSGPFVGSEFAYEDISSQEIGKYTYKYLDQVDCPTAAAGKCFKIEQIPAYEYSGYTKIHNYVDAQRFIPIKTEFYDRKEELLKSLDFIGYKQYLDKFWRADKFVMTNHQNGKSTGLNYNGYKFGNGLKEGDFVKGKLKNIR